MLTCPSVMARPQTCSAARIKTGRNGVPISAIVLHPIVGTNLESFEASMGTPLPNFTVGHTNPLSVHFLVSDLLAIQYADISHTTYGLDYLKNPTWPPLNYLYPLDDINAPFIHIAIKTDCSTIALINLICCIIQDVGINLPIVASSDLQSDRPRYEINPSLITQVADCVASAGNIPEPPNWIDLWKRVQALEVCCFSNTTQINLLKNRVTKNEQKIAKLELEIKLLKEAIASIFVIIADIPSILETIRLIQIQIQHILDTCCPEIIPDNACFHYQLLNGQEQTITPNQPVHLNPPTKVIDTEPPIVITGPLWRANLHGNCTWSLDGIVRFKLNQWCTGTIAKLVLVACGQRTIVASKTITSTSTQLVQLQFSGYLQASGCDNVYLEVDINDQTAQIVTFAEMKGCCT